MTKKKTNKSVSSVVEDEKVKRAIHGLATEIEKPRSYDAEDKLSVLINTLESRVASAVDARIRETSRKWAWRLGGIGTGIAAVYAILFIFGWREMRKPSEYVKRMYPPSEIFSDLRPEVERTVPKALQDPQITTPEELGLIADNIRSANDERIRSAFESPQKKVGAKFLREFSSRRPGTVMNVSTMRNLDYETQTKCGDTPNPEEFQAIVLRPVASARYFPPWIRCGEDFPTIDLEVRSVATGASMRVRLIGVHEPALTASTEKCSTDRSLDRPLICDQAELQLTKVAADKFRLLSGRGRAASVKVADAH